MGFWGFLTIVFIAYWLWSGSQKRAAAVKELKEREHQQELRVWEHHESDEFGSESYELDFAEMRLKVDVRSYTPGVDHPKFTYVVKRTPEGTWQRRFTEPSWRDREGYVKRMVEETKGRAIHGAWCDELEALQEGPKWLPLDEELQPSIETAYQRYVRQA